MLKFFKWAVIGGRSGKREQAWLLFILWAAAFAWMMHREVQGLDLPATQAILTLALPLVVANLVISHGMEWVSTQTGFGGNRPVSDDGFEE